MTSSSLRLPIAALVGRRVLLRVIPPILFFAGLFAWQAGLLPNTDYDRAVAKREAVHRLITGPDATAAVSPAPFTLLPGQDAARRTAIAERVAAADRFAAGLRALDLSGKEDRRRRDLLAALTALRSASVALGTDALAARARATDAELTVQHAERALLDSIRVPDSMRSRRY